MTLSEIQHSFFHRKFDLSSVETWLTGVAALTLLMVLYLAYRALQSRRARYIPHGDILNPREIRDIIRSAFDQRRPFEMQILSGTSDRRPTLRCSPASLAHDFFSIEINGLKSLSKNWIGRGVAVFFRVKGEKDFAYYTFSSVIRQIDIPTPGVCLITLSMPTTLENRQKRSFLRMQPPREYFKGGAMWHGQSMPPANRINDIAMWPKPLALAVPGRVEQFQVLDLSAGGSRLRIPHKHTHELRAHFSPAEQMILMMDLQDPDLEKRQRFWFECRVQNVWIDQTTRDIHMGLQFTGWGRPKEHVDMDAAAGNIEWLRLSKNNEVEPLGNWIMRRHLELFRDNPLEIK